MTKTLTKLELVSELAEKMGVTRKEAGDALDAMAQVVADNIAKGNTLTLPGVAKVTVRGRPERQMRNPSNGETITKAADNAVKITPIKALKDVANA